MLTNSYVLMTMAFVSGIIACFFSFGFVESLYKTVKDRYNKLLFIYAGLIGIGLFTIHAMVHSALSHLPIFGHGFSFYLILSYLFSYFIGLTILDVANKKTLPIKSLLIVGLQTGISSFAIFYFYSLAVIEDSFSITPMFAGIASILSMMVGVLAVITFFWLKKYTGPKPKQVKAFLSFVITIGIFATHIAYNSAIEVNSISEATKASIIATHATNILSALVLVFIFMTAFILMIFYDKLGAAVSDRKVNFVDTVNQKKKLAFDPLTKLPNRESLNQHLKTATKRCERLGHSLALAYIDLDHFKPVNDNFGHHVGDLLLIEVAERFNTAIRNCDYIARTGGDEFVAVLGDIDSNESIVTVTQRMIDTIKESFYIDGHFIEISCSIGVAIYPRDGSVEKLHLNADAAMYKAKENGKNQYRFYDSELEQASDDMQKLREQIVKGLKKKEFTLHYQPKVDTITQEPVGAEALLRWNHPEKGLLSPIYFLDAAERFGLIDELNTWVIKEVCSIIAEAKKQKVNLNISINLSRQQFRSPKLVENIKDIMAKYKISPESLVFEISETHAIHNQNQFKKILSQFRRAELKVSVDDFGLHPFSLTYLQDLEVSEIKLDKSFIRDVAKKSSSLAVVDAVIKLAHALNLTVVAEGVENRDQSRALATTGCDQLQGYYFSKPMPKDELFEMHKHLDKSYNETGEFSAADFQEVLKNVKKAESVN